VKTTVTIRVRSGAPACRSTDFLASGSGTLNGRSRSVTFDRLDDARRFLAGMGGGLVRGEFVDPAQARTRFDDWAEAWWQTTTGLRPTTRRIKHGRRKLVTTRRDKDATAAPDLVERDFSAKGKDELWVGDITYVPTGEGWLFVASVLDVFSRRLAGWSIADHLRTDLCLDALQAAAVSRGRLRLVGTKFHSDHGCQGRQARSG